MPEKKARPAHRPSRRHQIVDGAVELFSVKPPELVTIAEIVRHVDMTPAAFYYHFSSRDELLLEVLTRFGDEWASRAEQWWGEATDVGEVVEVAARLLDEATGRRAQATVFFVTSKGVSLSIEQARQGFVARVARAASAALARAGSGLPSARTAVDAVALVTVLESSLRAELALDPAYRTLGPRGFREQVLELCARVLEGRGTSA